MTEKEISESCREQNPSRSLNREKILEKCESSLVISWLGTGVARVLRRNSFEPMVGWKDEHPHSVSWLPPVIDK
jgi:hypothetical protein